MKLLRNFELLDYSPEIIKESRDKNNGKIMMKGILQKADALNQNGRVYPKNILDREIRNYQKFIIENRALGECVPPGTEIYTRDGWKNIEDISEDEIIATLNVKSNELQFQRITQKVILDHEGKMYRFKNHTSFDMCLTPNHKMLVWDRSGEPKTVTAQELRDAVKGEVGSSHLKWLSHAGLRRHTGESVVDHRETKNRSFDRHDSVGMALDFRFLKCEESDYSGKVYCVTVPNGTWLMRYNDKVCWTHNCDHPDASVINLKNVSHIVREAYMDEKGVVMGTVELLNTPSGKILQSLVESNVKLGISSRGVGSTRSQGDYQVVQDDFQLICFDIVSEPSTSGAFMIAEGKSISQTELQSVFTRSDRIDRIINDILAHKR